MTDTAIPLYSKDVLPADFEPNGGAAWASFRKTSLTRAIRIHGPFRVETSESENEPFFCEDGWLAIDARGYPYAIADAEFTQIYEPVAVEDTHAGLEQAKQTAAEEEPQSAADAGAVDPDVVETMREATPERFGCIDPKGDPAPAGEDYLQVGSVEPFTVDDIVQNLRTSECVRVLEVQDEQEAPALIVQRGIGGEGEPMEPGDELLVVATAAAQQSESA